MVQDRGRVAGRVGLTRKNMGRVTSQPVFYSGKKIELGPGQKILTRFAMSKLINHFKGKTVNKRDNIQHLLAKNVLSASDGLK